MQSKAKSPMEYLDTLPEDRRKAMVELRKVIAANLPKGFTEGMGYGMLGWVVPHRLYPSGYHCDPRLPLPFLSIASQKNHIAVYHMGLYADPALLEWFTAEYAKQDRGKLDMGKSCIRFKKPDRIPMKLIGELASKVTPKQWIAVYEKNVKR
jgi:hypothetical protein